MKTLYIDEKYKDLESKNNVYYLNIEKTILVDEVEIFLDKKLIMNFDCSIITNKINSENSLEINGRLIIGTNREDGESAINVKGSLNIKELYTSKKDLKIYTWNNIYVKNFFCNQNKTLKVVSEDSVVKMEEVDFVKSKSVFDKLNSNTIKKFLFFKCKKIEVPERILKYIDKQKK